LAVRECECAGSAQAIYQPFYRCYLSRDETVSVEILTLLRCGKTTATAFWLVEGLHPTLRKVAKDGAPGVFMWGESGKAGLGGAGGLHPTLRKVAKDGAPRGFYVGESGKADLAVLAVYIPPFAKGAKGGAPGDSGF
jgi:hypothetical protein